MNRDRLKSGGTIGSNTLGRDVLCFKGRVQMISYDVYRFLYPISLLDPPLFTISGLLLALTPFLSLQCY